MHYELRHYDIRHIYGITALRYLRFMVFNYGNYGTCRNRNYNFDGKYNCISYNIVLEYWLAIATNNIRKFFAIVIADVVKNGFCA